MSKSESKKGGSKSKDKKKKWSTSSTNQTTGLPMLKYGPDTNIHIWRKKIQSAAMKEYGNLAKLIENDKYYEPPIVPEGIGVSVDKDPDLEDLTGGDNDESKSNNSATMQTRSSGRKTSQSMGPTSGSSQETAENDGIIAFQGIRSPDEVVMLGAVFMQKWWHERFILRDKEIHEMVKQRPNLYAYIEQHMSRESIDEVQKDPEYEDFNKEKCPLKLWLAIKKSHEVATDSSVGVFRKNDSLASYAAIKQGIYETVVAYKQRFDYVLDAYVNSGNTQPTDEDQAAHYLRSLDDGKYRELKVMLENDELLGNDKMPKTLNAMHAVATKFKVAKKSAVSHHGTSFATTGDTSGGRKRRGNSGSQGRGSKADDDDDDDNTVHSKEGDSKGKKTLKCWKCGEPGHRKNECPQNEKREGNSYHTVFAMTQNKQFGWRDVLLDNQSDISVVDERLLTNVRPSETPYVIRGMGPTPLTCNKVGYLEGFFECVAGTDLRANILCMAHVEDIYPVEYVQGQKYIVKMEDRDLVAHRKGCMYVADMSDWVTGRDENDQDENVAMLTTVSGNEAKYTKKEVKAAKEVRELLKNAGYPSYQGAINLITKGLVSNMPYTAQDVKNAYDIYGPPTEFVRGRKTKTKVSRQIVDDQLRAGQQAIQTMYGDIMLVKKKPFLLTLSEPLGLLLVTPVMNTTSEELGRALQEQITTLRSRGFAPRTAYLDAQPGFTALVGNMPGVEIDITGAGDHLDKIDIKIRRLKEVIRSVHSGLPWKLPNMLIKDLVKYCVSRMNLHPSSSNDTGDSPRTMFTGRKPNYTKELDIGFGDYVEVYKNNVVSNDALTDRTLPCIAL